MELWHFVLLAALGLVAGILNVIAGGGSLLTLPAMVLMGMEGPTANGTNRVAILAQNITAISGFRSRGFSDFRLSLTLALASIPGAAAGAYTGTLLRGELFDRVLAIIMFGVIALMLFKRGKSEKPAAALEQLDRKRWILGHLCMIGVGFYGGFIQAGVGFLLMTSLHNVMGLDLVRVNMHKVFIVASYTMIALAIFVVRGHVLWLPAIVLAAGNSLGGWLGSQLSVSGGEKFIRRILLIALTVMAIKLLIG